MFTVKDKEILRPIQHVFHLENKRITLNEEQEVAYQHIQKHLSQSKTMLLKGVTGSGKTEIYLNTIEDVIKNGRSVFLLVPEIMLIGMMAQRLKSRFKDVIIYHSALSKGQKFDQVRKLQEQKPHIILGTRSALFLPLKNVGLIIMDEEHDASYEQREGLSYDAKDVAKELSVFHQAPLLLGSATPSIESMYEAQQKRYELIELNHRVKSLSLPKITFVNMTEELKNGHLSMFSKTLIKAIEERLEKNEQILILYNRKGYAPFVLCRQCGDVPRCPHCDISLTYYKDKDELKCHYCGYQNPYTHTCQSCGHQTVKPIGAGIEKVEQALHKLFPAAKVMRMDQSQTTKKGSHEKLWHDFNQQKADILLGTQMISKGLDFDHVTLVAVLMADLLLKVPSYQATEKTYMLLTQMSGRSGRAKPGQTIIQAYDLSHYAIQATLKPYDYFYHKALSDRKLLNYEPFQKVSQILFEGTSYLKTYQYAYQVKKNLLLKGLDCLGPAPDLYKKIKDRYRFTITIKYQTIDFEWIKAIFKEKQKDIYLKWIPKLD